MLGGLLVFTYGKVICSDEGIKLGSTCGEVIGTILVNVDEITLGNIVGTELGYLYGSFYGSNDRKLEGLLLGY